MLKTFKQASALYNEARSRRSPVIYCYLESPVTPVHASQAHSCTLQLL